MNHIVTRATTPPGLGRTLSGLWLQETAGLAVWAHFRAQISR